MKLVKRLSCLLLVALLFAVCGCSDSSQAEVEIITLSEEDQELLEEVSEDINFVDLADFKTTVSELTEDDVGKLFQLVGYYRSEGSGEEETDWLTSSDGETAIRLRYLIPELTVGEAYSVTGVVAVDSSDEEGRLVFDIVTIESYMNS